MTDTYLAEIRSVQPHGPYHLAGYCGGALVAYEMAQRLHALGEHVATVAVIDIARPGVSVGPGRLERWPRLLADESFASLWRLAVAKIRKDLASLVLTIRLAWYAARGSMPHELRDPWLTRAFLRMSARYRPAPYPGGLALFKARDGDRPAYGVGPDLGWGDVALGGVAVHEVPGNHHSLARAPNVQVLAALLEACVRSGEPPTPLREAG
jgi:thioesterase domain-containing protein